MKILVITDNEFIFKNFLNIIEDKKYSNYQFDFRFSYKNKELLKKYEKNEKFKGIDVKEQVNYIINTYDRVISLHCKQIFPEKLVEQIKCINVHPGYNPENRGWFPQVFSIINKKQTGVTIHYIDKELDHGKVIIREKVEMKDTDTSLSLYNRIQDKEIELLEKNLKDILEDKIESYEVGEGNLNYFSDFKKLCRLDLNEKLTMGEAIDKLRALTHGKYKNAYFYNKENNKVFVKICLEEENIKNE